MQLQLDRLNEIAEVWRGKRVAEVGLVVELEEVREDAKDVQQEDGDDARRAEQLEAVPPEFDLHVVLPLPLVILK